MLRACALLVCVGSGLVLAACGGTARPTKAASTERTGPSTQVSDTVASAASGSASWRPGVTFGSPLYGYGIALPAGWTATAATEYADDPASTGETATDLIPVPGTDTTIGALGWNLGTGTYGEWAKAYHDDIVGHVPSGCDGGAPATWPAVAVGSRSGFLLVKCNEEEAIVPDGRRVYVFTWGHASFDDARHMPESDFRAFLGRVTLPSEATAQAPLWPQPT